MIDDVINYLNETNQSGFLLALDSAKAFDSISREYLLHTFSVFGFKENFVKWVHILMHGSQSSIYHGGWVSEPFLVNCGIRQGCPFSAVSYVLAVELMAAKVRHSDIVGIKTPTSKCDSNNECKIKQLADDTTLFLKTKRDVEKSISLVGEFGRFSGLKLNLHKTKILLMGKQALERDLPVPVVEKNKNLRNLF